MDNKDSKEEIEAASEAAVEDLEVAIEAASEEEIEVASVEHPEVAAASVEAEVDVSYF